MSESDNNKKKEYQEWAIQRIPRAEGYSEFRCIPAHWITSLSKPMELYTAESLSTLMGVHKDPDFWSASDAAMRARRISPSKLDERELSIYGTRRSNDYNRATPWASFGISAALEREWQGDQDPHTHPFANIPRDQGDGLFGHYGMKPVVYQDEHYQVVTGYGMRDSQRVKTLHEPWKGGFGTWVSWQTALEWQEIPRRQEIEPRSAEAPVEGKLLLFVSHRWEDLAHPDPAGRQLLGLKVGLTLSLAAAVSSCHDNRATSSGLPELMRRYIQTFSPSLLSNSQLLGWAATVIEQAKAAQAEAKFWPKCAEIEESCAAAEILKKIRQDVLLWYDYTSMYQAPRTAAEQDEFRREIRLLNKIQAGAATVVISDGEHYLSRAWCFLEMSGGIRHSIVELTPTWSIDLGLHSSINKWSHISDQLIGALSVLGLDAMKHTGLLTTEKDDLRIIAELISGLPLMGLVESDGMDLIGGSIPMPFVPGKGWVLPSQGDPPSTTTAVQTLRISEFGGLPQGADLSSNVANAHADQLQGECGMWIFTTQRALSLAWAARSQEIFKNIGDVYNAGDLESVCCTWADARGLAEDGSGWTRYVPSSVHTLVIVTQADIPDMCLVYDSVLRSHLAAGCTVITLIPETGQLSVAVPSPCELNAIKADILVAARIRRSTAYPGYLMLPHGTSLGQLAMTAALRLDPSVRRMPRMTLTPEQLRTLSMRRVLLEAECRTTVASWDILLDYGLNPLDWPNADHGFEQMEIVSRVLQSIRSFSPSPLLRRRLLYAILEREAQEGEPLPRELPGVVAHIVESLRK